MIWCGAVLTHREQIISAHASCPRRVEMRDRPSLQLKRRIRGVICIGLKHVAFFVDTLWDVRCAETGHGLNFAEQIIQYIAPMCKHIEYDTAAFYLAVVP